MKRNEKIHFIFTLLATLLVLAAIVIFTFVSFYKVAKEDAIVIGETAVKERAEKLNGFLAQSCDIIRLAEEMVEYIQHKEAYAIEEIENYMTGASKEYQKKINENFMGIYGWVDHTYIDGSGWVPYERYEPTERIWYKEAKKANGEIVIVDPYMDAQKNQMVISIAVALQDGISVISIDRTLDDIQKIAENINLNGTGYGFVVNEDGTILAHSDAKERGKNYLDELQLQESDMNAVMKKVMNESEKHLSMEIDGEDCFVFSEKIEHGWHVVMIIKSSDLFARVESVLLICIILSMVIFIIVAYFCTASYMNKRKLEYYAKELKENQRTLKDRVRIQTQAIKDQAVEMFRMQEDVIEGMATLIESRDGNTGEHVRNTKKYVSMIVNRLNAKGIYGDKINQDYISKLINAAPLHDVGKIMISDVILNKPGKLNDDEFEIMKTHSSHGGDIVRSILGIHADQMLVDIAFDVAKYHHERWDGTGYPEGLKKEEIPLAARIMTVADVFDALISKRVYKEAMPFEQALAIIEKEAGKQFDPEVVAVFLEQKKDIVRFLNKQ